MIEFQLINLYIVCFSFDTTPYIDIIQAILILSNVKSSNIVRKKERNRDKSLFIKKYGSICNLKKNKHVPTIDK